MPKPLIFITMLTLAVFILVFGRDISHSASTSPMPIEEIKKINISVPMVMDEKVQAAVVEKLTSLEKLRFVYLDLSINFIGRGSGSSPFSMSAPVNGNPRQLEACTVIGALPMGRGMVYSLGPLANYNHLLMSVYTGDRARFPYHDVACEYVSGGNHQQFHLRGFFHVLANSIPTAVGLQLRPFNPPFELARKVLIK